MPVVGRPRALNEIKQSEICALISAGFSQAAAARYVDCSVRTIYREADRNEQFREKLRKARLAAQVDPLQAIRRAATTHWRAAAWFLERTQPERFAKRESGPIDPDRAVDVFMKFLFLLVDEMKSETDRQHILQRIEQIACDVERELLRSASKQPSLLPLHPGIRPLRPKPGGVRDPLSVATVGDYQ